jgi:hypothetical protein
MTVAFPVKQSWMSNCRAIGVSRVEVRRTTTTPLTCAGVYVHHWTGVWQQVAYFSGSEPSELTLLLDDVFWEPTQVPITRFEIANVRVNLLGYFNNPRHPRSKHSLIIVHARSGLDRRNKTGSASCGHADSAAEVWKQSVRPNHHHLRRCIRFLACSYHRLSTDRQRLAALRGRLTERDTKLDLLTSRVASPGPGRHGHHLADLAGAVGVQNA